jgi:hypothetical protein
LFKQTSKQKVKQTSKQITEYENENEDAYVIKTKEALRSWKWNEEEKFIDWLESKKAKMDFNGKSKFNADYVNLQIEEVINYCEMNNKKYSNYRSAVQKWINSDISGGKFK